MIPIKCEWRVCQLWYAYFAIAGERSVSLSAFSDSLSSCHNSKKGFLMRHGL